MSEQQSETLRIESDKRHFSALKKLTWTVWFPISKVKYPFKRNLHLLLYNDEKTLYEIMNIPQRSPLQASYQFFDRNRNWNTICIVTVVG